MRSRPGATGLLAAFVMAFGLAGCGSSAPQPDASRAIAAKFLDEIRSNHAAEAWQSTTAEFKSARGKEAFVREVRADKALKAEMAFVSQQAVKVQDEERPELLFRGGDREIRIVLGREGNEWKVDRWTHSK
ncbi:MAG TPA: hypothetical protein VM452_13720 [Caulifigura sp.]|nr:hypothetical protein [Caulifigura sp.]